MMVTHVSRAEEPANQRPFYAKPSAATFSSDKIKLFNTLMTDVGESNTMNAMTREEMTARLELVEAKADARLGRLEERQPHPAPSGDRPEHRRLLDPPRPGLARGHSGPRPAPDFARHRPACDPRPGLDLGHALRRHAPRI